MIRDTCLVQLLLLNSTIKKQFDNKFAEILQILRIKLNEQYTIHHILCENIHFIRKCICILCTIRII